MLAVLEHAVQRFRTYAFVAAGCGSFLFMEVAAWLRSTGTGAFRLLFSGRGWVRVYVLTVEAAAQCE
jgi:hypothetical protein